MLQSSKCYSEQGCSDDRQMGGWGGGGGGGLRAAQSRAAVTTARSQGLQLAADPAGCSQQASSDVSQTGGLEGSFSSQQAL